MLEPVRSLLVHARAHGKQAYYVPALGFDDLMTRLALHCLNDDQREGAHIDIAALAPEDLLSRQPFQVAEYCENTLIKSNAFEIDCPAEVLSFDLNAWPAKKQGPGCANRPQTVPWLPSLYKGKVLALGTVDDIKDIFGSNIKGPVNHTPISPDELRYEDGVIVGLMREALVRAIAEAAGVASDGRSELWLDRPLKKTRQDGVLCHAHESVVVFLRRVGGTQYVVLKPSIKVLDAAGAEVAHEIAGPVKLGILGYQHNKPFNKAVNKWRNLLFPKDRPCVFGFPAGDAPAFKFRIRRSPMFAQTTSGRSSRPPCMPSVRPTS